MHVDEMIAILESIIRDPEANPTARVTAIRALREIAPADPLRGEMAGLYAAPPVGKSRRRGVTHDD